MTGGSPGSGGLVGSGGAQGSGGAPSLLLDCPTDPLDPRVGGFSPGAPGVLSVASFVRGPMVTQEWFVDAEDCDAWVQTPSFTTSGDKSPELVLTPGRPGLHHIRLNVLAASGESATCRFPLQVGGRGVRVDLCWDANTTVDLDLYVHSPLNQAPYFDVDPATSPIDWITMDSCSAYTCGPLRFNPRPDFAYGDSPLEFCDAGPSGPAYRAAGHCPNPRASSDNNQIEANGTAEVVQIDAPRSSDVLRVMVHNFSNLPAVPRVFVYCSGQKVEEYELAGTPDNFFTAEPALPGVMWRVIDIFPQPLGDQFACTLLTLTSPTEPLQPFVTVNDVSY